MEYIFKTKNSQEACRIIKSDKMACFIWELVNNAWRDFKHTDYDYQPAWDKINNLLEDHQLNADELWE